MKSVEFSLDSRGISDMLYRDRTPHFLSEVSPYLYNSANGSTYIQGVLHKNGCAS